MAYRLVRGACHLGRQVSNAWPTGNRYMAKQASSSGMWIDFGFDQTHQVQELVDLTCIGSPAVRMQNTEVRLGRDEIKILRCCRQSKATKQCYVYCNYSWIVTCACSAYCNLCMSWLSISGDFAAEVMACSACFLMALSLLLQAANTESRSMLMQGLRSIQSLTAAQACFRICLCQHCHAASATRQGN